MDPTRATATRAAPTTTANATDVLESLVPSRRQNQRLKSQSATPTPAPIGADVQNLRAAISCQPDSDKRAANLSSKDQFVPNQMLVAKKRPAASSQSKSNRRSL